MKSKSEFKTKNSISNKQSLPNESAETEFSWIESSDFFRISEMESHTSTESTSFNQFNSDF
jgi:hypothetical protein